jgi:pseudouridine synthase
MERLQKILAQAGLVSRREAEKWIAEGRVSVNGEIVRKLGSKADPNRDKIKVDGKLVRVSSSRLYYLFHKPAGILTSLGDPQGRPHLGEWLESLGQKGKVFPVGRLDFNSSGLLLLTNDGELANRAAHPRYGMEKIYHVKISGRLSDADLDSLGRGVRLEDGVTAPARVRTLKRLRQKSWIEIGIREGRYREVRRMFAALGFFVEKLIRVRLGPLALGRLREGEMRPLDGGEIAALRAAVGLVKKRPADR